MFPVSASKIRDLEERLAALGVKDSDLVETFTRSSGAGGQNVNKLSTRVTLKHVPSGVEVTCQRERSQALNRFLARRMLVERLEAARRGEADARRAAFEKIRRQKRKRSKRAKDKMLAGKRLHGEKKAMRRSPGAEY